MKRYAERPHELDQKLYSSIVQNCGAPQRLIVDVSSQGSEDDGRGRLLRNLGFLQILVHNVGVGEEREVGLVDR